MTVTQFLAFLGGAAAGTALGLGIAMVIFKYVARPLIDWAVEE